MYKPAIEKWSVTMMTDHFSTEPDFAEERLYLTAVPQPAGQRSGLCAGHDAHSGKQSNDGRAAVADKGQRQPHDREHIQTHAHIEDNLRQNHARHAHAHIGGEGGARAPADPDAPQHNGGQNQQKQGAAHQSELLAAHGEDEVGIPGRECAVIVGLGLNALKIALPEQAPRADGQDGAALLKALVQGVQIVVQHHAEAHNNVVAVPQAGIREDKQPQDQRRGHNSAPDNQEPAQLDPAHPGHGGKNDNIDHTGAHISADSGDQAQHKYRISPNLKDGGDGADVPALALYFGNLERQQEDKGNFDNFVGLQVHGEAGDVQPVAVSVYFHAKGRKNQQNQRHAAEK